MNNMGKYIVLAVLALCVAGCDRSEPDPTVDSLPVTIDVQVGSLQTPRAPSKATRVIDAERIGSMLVELVESSEPNQGLATRTLNEDVVENFWFFLYDGPGTDAKLISKNYYNSTSVKLELFLKVGQRVAMVANTYDGTFGDSETINSSTYQDLINKSRVITAQTDLYMNGGNSLSMFGTEVYSSGTKLGVSIKRNIAKVFFNVKFSEGSTGIIAKGDWTIQICNLPTVSHFLPNSEASLFPESVTTFDYPEAVKNGPTHSPLSWYVPVNRRGTIAGTTQKDRKTNAPATATYAKIAVKTDIKELTYIVHLGANFTEDYNLNPNYLYTYNITLYDDPTNDDSRVEVNPVSGGSGDVLYYDADSKTMLVGKAPSASQILYFKFGSTVGFLGENPWSWSEVVFNPSGTADYSLYGNIPAYSGSSPNISADDYHNLANVKAGRGDPCRLVGMTVEEIKGFMTDADLYANEKALRGVGRAGGWRLPSGNENVDFVAAPTSFYDNESALTNANATYWGLNNTRAGGWFPIPGDRNVTSGRTVRNQDTDGFTPAAGYRNDSDGAKNTSLNRYWSSEPAVGGVNGIALEFNSTEVYARKQANINSGASVRCVWRQVP